MTNPTTKSNKLQNKILNNQSSQLIKINMIKPTNNSRKKGKKTHTQSRFILLFVRIRVTNKNKNFPVHFSFSQILSAVKHEREDSRPEIYLRIR